MALGYNKVRAIIHLDRLRDNFRLISAWCANPIPVIKADAYGHGLFEVAGVMAAEGARTLAVGTVGEAAQLRERFDGRIIALLGPVDDEDCRLAWEARIVPVIHHQGSSPPSPQGGRARGAWRWR
jgi:alanine racemase